MDDFTDLIYDGTKQRMSDLTGYNLIDSSILAVPDNYLDVIDMTYYFPNDFQKNIPHNKTDGQINAIDMIYSDQGLNPYNSQLYDYYNITTCSNNACIAGQANFTWEVPILLPKGIESVLSQKVGTVMTLCQANSNSDCYYKYRTLVRSYLTKLPGFLMTGFKQLAHLNLIGVVSQNTYAQMMEDFNVRYDTAL